ncbi:MAG TPA: hypothetical protein VMV92_39165 [Streptosporangiaceae bacterium]|nr:hypothetical protein [Streptosporangiaceae bacterium]
MTDGNPYGYDPATDTVRVGRHDLARLLLQFRAEVERPGRRLPWSHMHDYDKSFERLADAVDYARSVAPYGTERGPDYRMRCKRAPAYEWPGRAPYDGSLVSAVSVRPESRHGSHYAVLEGRGAGRALCGFTFAREEARPITGGPSCAECVREHALASALPARE